MNNAITSKYINSCKSVQELRQALEKYDKETILDTLVYVIDNYIIQSPAERDEPVINNTVKSNVALKEPVYSNFYEMILHLKNSFQYPELKNFTIENGKVYFSVDERKIEIGSNQIKNAKIADTAKENEEKVNHDETYKRFSNLEIT